MLEELKNLKVGKVISAPLMKNYTTYKVGGEALALVSPKEVDDLRALLSFLQEKEIKFKIIGNGSNLIFSDEPFAGVIIKLDEFNKLEVKNNFITVGAGYSIVKLCLKVAKLGLTGLEFASGIPATVGGAVFMNAGAYKSDMGYITTKIKVLTPNMEIKTLYNKDLEFHYRTSFLQTHPGYICLEATFALHKGKADAILDVISERKKRRLESQPLEYPSAGSVFRNPPNDFAGRLIEELGYKGKMFGGAQVSEKHANFIINKNDAQASDVRNLILDIQKKVQEKFNIDLKIEQEFVD